MPKTKHSNSFFKFIKILDPILLHAPELKSQGNRPLKMTFKDQLNALIYFHLEEHSSGRELIQYLNEDDFAKEHIAPKGGIQKSSFFEVMNTRGVEQMEYVFNQLAQKAQKILPRRYQNLGELVNIDGSLIQATLSMHWADYQQKNNKAKVHIGFNVNQGIPNKIHLTSGKGAERPFLQGVIRPGQTVIGDRGYQEHALFDQLEEEGKKFVIRIKSNTIKSLIKHNQLEKEGSIFYDAEVYLGEKNSKTKQSLRLVAYKVDSKEYWIATNRRDVPAESIAQMYKLRWDIETFFAWWKKHLGVYHLIARSEHGLAVQMLAGLITYILLAIHCHEEHGERVSIKRVRQLRIKIENELRESENIAISSATIQDLERDKALAKT